MLIAATNSLENIDPTILRAGRLHLQLKVDLPNLESGLAIFQVRDRERPLQDVDLTAKRAQDKRKIQKCPRLNTWSTPGAVSSTRV